MIVSIQQIMKMRIKCCFQDKNKIVILVKNSIKVFLKMLKRKNLLELKDVIMLLKIMKIKQKDKIMKKQMKRVKILMIKTK